MAAHNQTDKAGDNSPALVGGAESAGAVETVTIPLYVVAFRRGQEWLRQYPGLGLTIGYLFLTAVGMVYEFLFFQEFDLQIFDFADPSDFLLVAVRQPILLLFTLLSLLTLQRASRNHARRLKRSEKYRRFHLWLRSRKWWRFFESASYVLILVGYFFTFCAIYAQQKAASIRNGNGRLVQIELNSEAGAAVKTASGDYALLGTTTRYLILYNISTKRPEILPINNLARMRMVPPPTESATAAPPRLINHKNP